VAELVRAAKHIVVYTGAGVSTSTSLPDFRGPKGVWTLAAKGTRPEFDKKLEELHPTVSRFGVCRREQNTNKVIELDLSYEHRTTRKARNCQAPRQH
jgi:hypothetical protein